MKPWIKLLLIFLIAITGFLEIVILRSVKRTFAFSGYATGVEGIGQFLDAKEESFEAVDLEFLDTQASYLAFSAKLSERCPLAKETTVLYEKASNLYTSLLKQYNLSDEELIETKLNVARMKIGLNKPEEALDICNELLDKYPSLSLSQVMEVYHRIGEHFIETKKYKEAMDVYQELLRRSAYHTLASHAHIGIGWCYYKKGEYNKAIEEYRRSLEASFLDTEERQWVYLEMGSNYFFLKDYKKAKEAFLKVADIDVNTDLARQAEVNIKDMEKLNN